MTRVKTPAPCCSLLHAHPDVVSVLRTEVPGEETLMALADLFRIFGDSTRIKILYALLDRELCVCDIASLLSMTVSAISHQLRVLKAAKLVRFRRSGKTVFYTLADGHVRAVLAQGMEHVTEL